MSSPKLPEVGETYDFHGERRTVTRVRLHGPAAVRVDYVAHVKGEDISYARDWRPLREAEAQPDPLVERIRALEALVEEAFRDGWHAAPDDKLYSSSNVESEWDNSDVKSQLEALKEAPDAE